MHLKRVLSIVLAFLLSFSCITFADESRSGVSDTFEEAAVNLYINGLFKGAADGFELSSTSTKAQAAVMVVRLLGAEDNVLADSYPVSFTDVPEWASDYIGYLEKNGIDISDSATTFGANSDIGASDFTVMILQALGYRGVTVNDVADVTFGYAVQDGLLTWDEVKQIESVNFNRGAMAYIANKALTTKLSGSDKTLYDSLKEKGAIDSILAPTDDIKYGTFGSTTQLLNTVTIQSVNSLGQLVTSNAGNYMGIRYRSGGKSPSTGFDCSGFVGYVMIQSGVWSQFYGSCDGVHSQCSNVSKSVARAGDIVFFTGTYASSHHYTHVGIYLGNNRMIHASSSQGVMVSNISSGYWAGHFSCIARPNVMM